MTDDSPAFQTGRAMHFSELGETERASFEMAMETVREMSPEEREAMLEHAVASAIQFASQRDDEVLHRWARSLLGTIRLHGNKAYREAVADHSAPERPLRKVSASSMLAAVRR